MECINCKQMKELVKCNENFNRINLTIELAKVQKGINELKTRFDISDNEINNCIRSLNDTKN